MDVRIIAATNRDIHTEVQLGHFREDLFYRLNVIPIHLPPLRERKRDITKLIDHFLGVYSKEVDISFSHEALMKLVNYQWEGNIRQLKNVIQRTIALTRSSVIQIEELPDEIQRYHPLDKEGNTKTIADVERAHIMKILEECEYNKVKAAEMLGIHRNTLSRKIKEYNIDVLK